MTGYLISLSFLVLFPFFALAQAIGTATAASNDSRRSTLRGVAGKHTRGSQNIPATTGTSADIEKSFQTIYLYSETWLVKPEIVQGKLQEHTEFDHWGLSSTRDAAADVVIEHRSPTELVLLQLKYGLAQRASASRAQAARQDESWSTMKSLPRGTSSLPALILLTNFGVSPAGYDATAGSSFRIEADGKKAPKKSLDFKVLARRSKFFPDLAASDKTLSTGQKFRLFISDSASPAAFLGAGFSAGLGQARNNFEGYGQGAQGYGKRLGAAMATSSSTQFFGTFLLPSVLHQDPRLFVKGNGSLRQSVKYGLLRVVITRTDSRKDAINWSGLLGHLAAQGLANTYLPEEEQTVPKTLQRYGTSLALRAALNVAKEYWPTIFKSLMKPKSKQQ